MSMDGAYPIWPMPLVDYGYKPFLVKEKFLSPRLCKKALDMADAWGYETWNPEGANVQQAWLYYENGESDWLFERLEELVLEFNSHHRFALSGFVERLRVLTYRPGDHNEMHVDHTRDDMSKFAITVALSSPSKYEGGEFTMVGMDSPFRLAKGDAIIWHAMHAHEAMPVTKGERSILAAWVAGPRFI